MSIYYLTLTVLSALGILVAIMGLPSRANLVRTALGITIITFSWLGVYSLGHLLGVAR